MGMSFGEAVTAAVQAVAPIDGVSIGVRTDKLTWTVHFQAGATAPQMAAAQAVIDAFDLANGEQSYINALPAAEDDRPRIVRARVRLTAPSFSITSGTPRSIPFTNEQVDPLGMHDPSTNPERITIVQPGWYRFVVGMRFTEGTRTGTRALQVALGLGGSPTDLGTMRLAPALAGDTSFGFTEFALLAAGDIIRCFCEQGSGSAMNAVARITMIREE